MPRTHIVGLLVLAAARVAAADETATSMPAAAEAAAPSTTTSAPSAPTTPQLVEATSAPAQQAAKRQIASRKSADAKADPPAATSQEVQPGGDVKMSGMSILGNEDAPKSLVIVPWKSSQLADMPSVSRLLDSATQPVDKDVFMRELSYYEFKSSSK